MKSFSLFAFAGVLFIGTLSAQTANAQSARLDPNQLTGNQTNGDATFFITAGNGNDGASHFKLSGPNSSSRGYIGYISGWNPFDVNNISHEFIVRRNSDSDFLQALVIRQNGQVQITGQARIDGRAKIGLTVPIGIHSDYQLSVDGKLVAKSVYVTAANWADYVFDKGYHLAPLAEVEAYVKANKHLPEVPTTCEVEERGIDVAAINTLLLKKVEELTLHVIELNKRLEAVEAAKK